MALEISGMERLNNQKYLLRQTHIQILAQLYLKCQRAMNSIFKSLEEEWKFNLTNEYNKVLNLCKLMYPSCTQRTHMIFHFLLKVILMDWKLPCLTLCGQSWQIWTYWRWHFLSNEYLKAIDIDSMYKNVKQ